MHRIITTQKKKRARAVTATVATQTPPQIRKHTAIIAHSYQKQVVQQEDQTYQYECPLSLAQTTQNHRGGVEEGVETEPRKKKYATELRVTEAEQQCEEKPHGATRTTTASSSSNSNHNSFRLPHGQCLRIHYSRCAYHPNERKKNYENTRRLSSCHHHVLALLRYGHVGR